MSSHKPLFSLLLVAALAGGIWIVLSGNGPDALPRDLDRVDPSSAFLNAEASISYYREAIHRNPDAVEERARLAHVLLQQARSTAVRPNSSRRPVSFLRMRSPSTPSTSTA